MLLTTLTRISNYICRVKGRKMIPFTRQTKFLEIKLMIKFLRIIRYKKSVLMNRWNNVVYSFSILVVKVLAILKYIFQKYYMKHSFYQIKYNINKHKIIVKMHKYLNNKHFLKCVILFQSCINKCDVEFHFLDNFIYSHIYIDLWPVH